MKDKFKKENNPNTIESIVLKEQLNIFNLEEEKKFGKVFVYIGDVLNSLKKIEDQVVDCVITSPPYWKQRDYKDKRQIGQENSFEEYIKNLLIVFNEIKRVLKPTGTFFLNVGYKYLNKELLLIPELLAYEIQKNGWALLNKIIWHKPNAMPSSIENRFSNVYEPIFLFVKKENKYNYYLSLDKLRIKTNSFDYNKRLEEIVGLKVINSLFKNKKMTGTVSNVFQNSNSNLFAEVSWENKKKTIEILNDFDKESQAEINLICNACNNLVKNEIEIEKHKNCNGFLKPIFPDNENFFEKNDIRPLTLIPIEIANYDENKKNKYNGKFKENPDLRGSSPGARKALFGEYFVLQRRYRIFQPVIAEYLRHWRSKKNIKIKEIDKLLGYKDTAGHWFRKDTGSWGRGGSIPLPSDWFKLKKILDFDDLYDKWVTQTHLVLQTVKAHPKGKNPGDLWSIKLQPFKEAHFATFPEELVKRCILAGCPENGVVLDPFAGSGTTGKVAQELGRTAILIELVQTYLDIIKKRCKNIEEIIYVK